MYISAFLHRDALFEITGRWLSSRLEPQDPLQITRIINYDGFAAWETLLGFIPPLLTHLGKPASGERTIHRKKDLKDWICNGLNDGSSRIHSLCTAYRSMPEFYFTGSPVAGKLFHDKAGRIICFSRLKRVRRIAEKANRYVSAHIFQNVQKEALALLRQRGIRSSATAELPLDILTEAEIKVMGEIKENGIHLPVQALTLKDVLGMKIIDTGFGEQGIESAIDSMASATIVEKEHHTGDYNAVHYVIELTVDFQALSAAFRQWANPSVLASRGLPTEDVYNDFDAFIRTGVDSVQVDLILTSFDELVESEIGRSMHEIRIFRQRQQNAFYGNIPVNIEYILEFMLAVGLSPTVTLDDIPIKIWGRYLPDTLSHLIRQLYHLPEYALLTH
ncbi:MAG: hypothetical protein JEZ11_05030 [Desulfobacterales bacterium]|nr:hypothetical protein [Desulfobacterales bacterium]